MNDFERALAGVLGEEKLAKIQKVKVGIAGAGGLGSNSAMFLVRSGFKKLKIVDFDVVENSNLNRQFFFAGQVGHKKVEALKENLQRINSGLIIETLAVRIDWGNAPVLFADCDVVIEALDGAGTKRMLAEAYLSTEKLLVSASGLAGWGRSDGIKIHRLKENFYIVGDMVSGVDADNPVLAPGVNVAAAKQADVVLNYVLGGKGDGS